MTFLDHKERFSNSALNEVDASIIWFWWYTPFIFFYTRSNDCLSLYFPQSKIIWRSHLVSWWRSSDALVTPCPDATMASPMIALSNHSAFEKSWGLGSTTSPSGSRLSQKLGKDKSLRWVFLLLWLIQRNLWSWNWLIIPQSHNFGLFYLRALTLTRFLTVAQTDHRDHRMIFPEL